MAPDESNKAARGRAAERPSDIPRKGWKDVLLRVKGELKEDRVALTSAGIAFMLLLSLFPAIAALVAIYGLFADPATIENQMAALQGVVPAQVLEVLRGQVHSVAAQNDGALSLGAIGGLLFALWGANKGVKAVFDGMNIAYEEEEKRGFVRLTLTSLAFTAGFILFVAALVFLLGVLPTLVEALGLGAAASAALLFFRWPLLLAAAVFAVALVHRYGPSRDPAKWRWVSWGAAITAVAWIAASILFSAYVSNFADYNATYGSLGAAIALMTWLWLSSFILLAGAELNSEMERQTGKDTTAGPPEPRGEREAAMADAPPAAGRRDGGDGSFTPGRRRVEDDDGRSQSLH